MKNQNIGTLEFLRNGWFLIVFIGGVIWWAARQDSSLSDIERLDSRTTSLENRATLLETGIGQLQLKIDSLKEDIGLIKTAVIKN